MLSRTNKKLVVWVGLAALVVGLSVVIALLLAGHQEALDDPADAHGVQLIIERLGLVDCRPGNDELSRRVMGQTYCVYESDTNELRENYKAELDIESLRGLGRDSSADHPYFSGPADSDQQILLRSIWDRECVPAHWMEDGGLQGGNTVLVGDGLFLEIQVSSRLRRVPDPTFEFEQLNPEQQQRSRNDYEMMLRYYQETEQLWQAAQTNLPDVKNQIAAEIQDSLSHRYNLQTPRFCQSE